MNFGGWLLFIFGLMQLIGAGMYLEEKKLGSSVAQVVLATAMICGALSGHLK